MEPPPSVKKNSFNLGMKICLSYKDYRVAPSFLEACNKWK